jgi:hypothetical protein
VAAAVDFVDPNFGNELHASAAAGFGVLRASTSYDVDEFSGAKAIVTSATAQTQDRITITGLPNGTPGRLHITFDLEGSASENVPGKVWGFYSFCAHSLEQDFVVARTWHGIVNGPVVRDPIDFEFGEPFPLTLTLTVEIQVTGLSGKPPFEPVFAMIDYGNTVTWTGASVTDAQGQPVPGFALTSESGTSYPIPVPEPGRPLLLLLGAGLLAARGEARGPARWPARRERAEPGVGRGSRLASSSSSLDSGLAAHDAVTRGEALQHLARARVDEPGHGELRRHADRRDGLVGAEDDAHGVAMLGPVRAARPRRADAPPSGRSPLARRGRPYGNARSAPVGDEAMPRNARTSDRG